MRTKSAQVHTPSGAPYRLTHGATLTSAQAAHLLTRAASGEALSFAPVRRGSLWVLAHLTTLSAAERSEYARRLALTADLLGGLSVPAAISA